MAKSLTHVTVFLASPSDLAEERKAVAAAVAELNNFLRTTINVCLDLTGWETHAFPSVGVDAQDVINQQIADDYDIFLGLMWSRFGTPTGRAGSGTEEEFDRAYSKYKATSGRSKVMLYFSSKPISIDNIETDQIEKIKKFKKKAQELGVLHWEFNKTDDLVQLLKLHLPHHVKDVLESESISIPVKYTNNLASTHEDYSLANASLEDNAAAGYWDLMEVFHENFSKIENVMQDFTNNIYSLTESMNKSAEKLDKLKERDNYKPTEVKIIIDRFSRDVFTYVNKNRVGLGRFNELYTNGLDSFTKAIFMADDMGYTKLDKMEELLSEIHDSRDSIKYASKSARDFRYQIKGFPPMSKNLNVAVKLLDNSLDKTVKEFNGCEKMLNELSDVVEDKITRLKNKDNSNGETGASLVEQNI